MPNDPSSLDHDWQCVDAHTWVFGRVLRGLLREVKAMVRFSALSGKWAFMLCSLDGVAPTAAEAIEAAERAMGLLPAAEPSATPPAPQCCAAKEPPKEECRRAADGIAQERARFYCLVRDHMEDARNHERWESVAALGALLFDAIKFEH